MSRYLDMVDDPSHVKKLTLDQLTSLAEEVRHELFKEKIPVGLLFHIQARVLARTLRGDIPAYRPFMPS